MEDAAGKSSSDPTDSAERQQLAARQQSTEPQHSTARDPSEKFQMLALFLERREKRQLKKRNSAESTGSSTKNIATVQKARKQESSSFTDVQAIVCEGKPQSATVDDKTAIVESPGKKEPATRSPSPAKASSIFFGPGSRR
jgi:hypothetical protein